MIKTAKRLMGILLVFAMIFSLNIPAFAEETGSIQGDIYLYAPPEGTYSIVPYTLLEADGEASVRDAVWSMDKTIPGVRLNSKTGEIILSGTDMTSAGSFILTATTAEGEVNKTITIPDYRLYETFEEQTVGAKVKVFGKKFSGDNAHSDDGLHNTKVQIKEEDNGNKYASLTLTPGGSGTPYQNLVFRWAFKNKAQGSDAENPQPPVTGTVTAGFRILVTSTEHVIQESNGESIWVTIGTKGLQHKSGTSSDFVLVDNTTLSEGWADVYIAADYYKDKYSVYINGKPALTDADLRNGNPSYQTISTLIIKAAADNVSLFSGTPVSVDILSDLPESIAVGSKGAKLPVKEALKIGENEFEDEILWESTSEDVSVSDGFLTVQPDASAGEVILTAKSGNVEKNFTLKIEEAIEEDYSGEENGYLEGDAVIDVSKAAGIYTVKAKVRGTNAVLEGLGSNIPLGLSDSEFSDLHIFIDTRDNTYTVISNNKSQKGEYTSLGDITVSDGIVDDLYCGSIYDENPIVADVEISGRTVVGQSISLSYNYYSYLYEKKSQSVQWYLNSDWKKDGDNFLIENDMIGSKVSGKIIVTGGDKESIAVESAPLEIADMYSIEKTADGVDISVIGTGDELTFIVAAAWIKGGKTEKITAKKITSYDMDISLSLAAPIEADGVRVWLMNSDLSALALPKYDGATADSYDNAGLTEKIVKYEDGNLLIYDSTGQMVTVIIYNPLAADNFVESYSSISASMYDTDWTNELCYMNTVNANAKIPVTPGLNGFYTVKALFADGTEKESNFVYGTDSLFKNDKLKTFSESDFSAVMQNCNVASDSEEGKALYASFLKADSSTVNTLMQAEGYDMSELETAILISTFLEDKANKETLTAHLKARTLPTEGAELLAENLDFAQSAAIVKLNGGIEKALESMFETAILQGVAKSGNYLQTKPYLEAAGEYTISDNMALSFTGKTYGTLTELKEAIEGYKEPSGGDLSNNGDTESSDGLIGSSPAGGIVGGSGGSGGGGSSPGKQNSTDGDTQESGTSAFTDVSSAHWAYGDIAYLVQKEIISGMGDGSFAPDSSITRAEYVKILASAFPMEKLADEIQFGDVNKTDWYYEYIAKASKAGIVTGDGTGFKPNASITRQDAAVMLYRVLNHLGVNMEEAENAATDSGDVSTYALKAVNSLYGAGILSGMADGRFMPKTNITRAQAAAIVARVLR